MLPRRNVGLSSVTSKGGKKGRELELVFGGHAAELVVVHKDDLVTELAHRPQP